MNNPHVDALIYHIEHDDSVNYEKARPFVRDEPAFRVKVRDRKVCFKLKKHYATELEARQSIDKYIRVWELDAGLKRGPDFFKLKFARAKIVDRNPTPGKKSVSATPVRLKITTSVSAVTIAPPDYPSPPSGLSIDPDVQTMYDRYMHYRRGHESLASMAYFCFTTINYIAKMQKIPANQYYNISKKVLNRVSQLSSTKGGSLETRKREGINDDLTAQERSFLQEAVKKIIYRAAEKANDSMKNLSQITLSDLPSV